MLIKLKDVHYTSILSEIDLDIAFGDFVIVLGSNGCGKSTLLKLIDGSLAISSGLRIVKGNVSRLCQDLDSATFGELTVYENMRLVMRKAVNQKKAAAILESYHPELSRSLGLQVKLLSGGQRQALALALCLVSECDLLMLDEHTSALDPIAQKELMELTDQCIKEKKAKAIVMVTHDLEIALNYGNRLIAMDQGKIIASYQGKDKEALKLSDLNRLFVGRNYS